MDTEEKKERNELLRLERQIAKMKAALVSEIKNGGFYENFGQCEYQQIRDKFSNLLTFGGYENRMKALTAIRNFNDWCDNLSLDNIQ